MSPWPGWCVFVESVEERGDLGGSTLRSVGVAGVLLRYPVGGVRGVPHGFVPPGFLVQAGHLGQALITGVVARLLRRR